MGTEIEGVAPTGKRELRGSTPNTTAASVSLSAHPVQNKKNKHKSSQVPL